MCDVKTIAATVMPKKYRSNCNAELSPLQKYGKTTHIRFENYKSNCNAGLSPLQNMGRQLILDLKIIKATAMLDYLPCKIWEDNSFIRFESNKSNFNAGLSPLEKFGKTTLV